MPLPTTVKRSDPGRENLQTYSSRKLNPYIVGSFLNIFPVQLCSSRKTALIPGIEGEGKVCFWLSRLMSANEDKDGCQPLLDIQLFSAIRVTL